MTRRRWILVVGLYLASLALAYAMSFTELGSRTVRIGIELDTLALVVLVMSSSVVTLWLAIRSRTGSAVRQAVGQSEHLAMEERRRFLRRLDHEFKNPLTAIRAGLANLDSTTPGDTWLEIRSSIESQVLRLSRLTSDLRKLADLESRPLEESGLVDTEELLKQAFEAAQETPAAKERELALITPQAPWPLPQIRGDSDLLFLAFFNLLDNALKFTRAGDTVEVRAMDGGEDVIVEIADTGVGIPSEEVSQVWEELYRGRDAQRVSGSGLGLSLVKAIVERHGGSVELRSKPNHGTVIAIRLPQGS
jgi:two-component system OmpR family sensor kinase